MCKPNVNKLINVEASHLTSNSTGGCGKLPYNNNLRFPDRPDLVESSSNNELVACATLYCEKHKTANATALLRPKEKRLEHVGATAAMSSGCFRDLDIHQISIFTRPFGLNLEDT